MAGVWGLGFRIPRGFPERLKPFPEARAVRESARRGVRQKLILFVGFRV